LRISHLQYDDQIMNAICRYKRGIWSGLKMRFAMANEFGPSSSPQADNPTGPRQVYRQRYAACNVLKSDLFSGVVDVNCRFTEGNRLSQ